MTHESKAVQSFNWVWFEEIMYETSIPNAGSIPTKKNQKAIALNLKLGELTERKIGFQQTKYKKSQFEIFKKLQNDRSIILRTNSDNILKEIEKKDSYNNMINLYKNSFKWAKGTYDVKLTAHDRLSKIQVTRKIKFSLQQTAVDSLETNINKCNQVLENYFSDGENKVPVWEWAYEVVIPVDDK